MVFSLSRFIIHDTIEPYSKQRSIALELEDQLPPRETARPVPAYSFGDWLLDSLVWCLLLSAFTGMILRDSWIAGGVFLVALFIVLSRWYMFIYLQMPDRERRNMEKMTGFFGHLLKAVGKLIEGAGFAYLVAPFLPADIRSERARQLAGEIPQSLEPMQEIAGDPDNYVLNIPLGLRKFRLEPALLLTMICSAVTVVLMWMYAF